MRFFLTINVVGFLFFNSELLHYFEAKKIINESDRARLDDADLNAALYQISTSINFLFIFYSGY